MSHLRRLAVAGLSVTTLVAIAAPASAATRITDLGVPKGSLVSQAADINASGVIVGDNETRAVRWTDTITVLPSLGGPSSAYAINAEGTAVGWSNDAENLAYAVKWDSAGALTTLEGGDSARGINDSGVIVGTRWAGTFKQAVRWDANGQISDLTPLSRFDSSEAEDVNNNGVAVGDAILRTGNDYNRYAMRWEADGTATKLGLLNGYKECIATAVNAAGTAVGNCWNPSANDSHAVRWDSAGNVVDLGVLCGVRSWATGINDSGTVVGSATDGRGNSHAVAWDQHNACRDLGNLPGGTWAVAREINNAGAIVGYARHSAAPFHAVRWDD
jgi:probable HAF family extracellular repeat protein